MHDSHLALLRRHRGGRVFAAVPRRGVWLLILSLGLIAAISHADPGDFQAMPGLWRTVITRVSQGRPGTPVVEWHCVHEGADPWASFADPLMPAPRCQRDDAHRASTALAWTLSCAGKPKSSGQGRIDFDSAEHYRGGITLVGQGEVLRVEGRRYAACTDPSD